MDRATKIARTAGVALLGSAILTELRKPPPERHWHGEIAGIVPYDLRVPTIARLRERWWNPHDARLLTPQVFGVGWSINLARLVGITSSGADVTPAPARAPFGPRGRREADRDRSLET